MYLYGKNQVEERIKADPKSIRKIFFNKRDNNPEIKILAEKSKIAYSYLNENEFSRIADKFNSQGVIAEVLPFSYANYEELLELPAGKKVNFLALSNITDPQNLGSILRTAACFGNFAVIIPKHRSAEITETVLRVACGAENYVPVCLVTNLVPAIEAAKKAGYWTVGTVIEGGTDVFEFNFPSPVFLVIGAEDKGIRQGIVSQLDFKITLPMPGQKLSLNAAVASAVFCYEIIR